MKKIALLGSTGSIGKSTLQIARHLGYEVVSLAARSNIDLIEVQAKEFNPKLIAIFDPERAHVLQKRLPHIPVMSGMDGLISAATLDEANFTMLAMSGSDGLRPALAAISKGKEIGLANKEILVSAGELVSQKAKEKGIQILPVDSEHSALFQCLNGENANEISRLILTASGGPFREVKDFSTISIRDALTHPNFIMGPKVSVDSSTLMNKGLEMIEARWLFDVDPKKIEAIIHPEQLIHSMVEFVDGSMMAQISEPDMLLPIQYALTYPKREKGILAKFDFQKNSKMTFFKPDTDRFRCLYLAMFSMQEGKSYPCFLNAANEVLVEKFLQGKMEWQEIGRRLEKLISSHTPQNLLSLEAIQEMDRFAREQAGAM